MGHRRPEMAQTRGDWSAGVAASYALADLMRAITCEDRGRDRYGRSIGLCRADGQHLGAAMVSAAFTRYSSDYVWQEEKARRETLGVHAPSPVSQRGSGACSLAREGVPEPAIRGDIVRCGESWEHVCDGTSASPSQSSNHRGSNRSTDCSSREPQLEEWVERARRAKPHGRGVGSLRLSCSSAAFDGSKSAIERG